MEEEEQHQYVDLGDSSDGDIEVIDITEETSPVRRRPRPRYRSPMALYKGIFHFTRILIRFR